MNETSEAATYRWNELPQDRPMELVARRRIFGKRVLLAEVSLRKGCRVPRHRHENEQFVCVLSGGIRFEVGEESEARDLVVRGGEVLHLPSNVPHSAEALEDSQVLDVFSPPSETTGIDR
jgi:quercetin dioxygenase-like cupin family protein